MFSNLGATHPSLMVLFTLFTGFVLVFIVNGKEYLPRFDGAWIQSNPPNPPNTHPPSLIPIHSLPLLERRMSNLLLQKRVSVSFT